VEVVASLSQGRTAAAQCGLFTYKSVPVIFEPHCIYIGETELCKTGIVIRDFQPSASESDFILSCEGFSLLHSFDTRFSVHSAEFDGVVALGLSAAVAVYFVVSVMTVIASTSRRGPPSLTPHQHYFACCQSITARVNIVEATGGF